MITLKKLLKSIQNLKGLRLLFSSLPQTITLSSKLTAQSSKQSLQSNILRHTSEITLDAFLDCLVNHNLRRLIKHGTALPNQLAEVWECLYSEWCDISGNTQYKQVQTIKNDYYAIHSRKESVDIALLVLSHRYSVKQVDILKGHGYNYRFDWSDPESYRKDLNSIYAKSKTLELVIEVKRAEYERMKGSLSAKEVTMADWDLIIASVEAEMNGRAINRKETTVSEFAGMQKYVELKREAEQRELQKMKK